MYYEIHGRGRRCCSLHGGTCSIELPSMAIPFFASEFQVIAIEQMGHGRTADAMDREFHYHDMAEDTVELMRQLEIESAFVFGLSDGGIVGLGHGDASSGAGEEARCHRRELPYGCLHRGRLGVVADRQARGLAVGLPGRSTSDSRPTARAIGPSFSSASSACGRSSPTTRSSRWRASRPRPWSSPETGRPDSARALRRDVQDDSGLAVVRRSGRRARRLGEGDSHGVPAGRSQRRGLADYAPETFIRREDAERFIEEVRRDDPELAGHLRIEERELEVGELN